VYRVSRAAGFELAPPTTTAVATFNARLTQRVNRSSTVQASSPLTVEVSGRTAILRGSVASDRARELAARLILLEPGVDQVDNQLQVVGAAEPQ
jgi:osmotically-inducible protein OsmY